MNHTFTNIRWLRIIVSSIIIAAFSIFAITIITAGYAFILAFEAHGQPNQAAINHFAAVLSRWAMPALEMILTFLIAMISTKKIDHAFSMHGLLIGIGAGMLSTLMKFCFGHHLHYRLAIFFVILAGLGLAGGFWTQRKKKMKP
ncbi:MAG TPA: hypothetical protein VMU30_00490 [Bacteroidota bacterium]|nr:hypothetical protein [Bacteroidota bacterium]